MMIIDRHLLRSLATPLVYCLAAFVIMIVVHDLFDHVSDFIEANTPLKDVLRFYLFLLPSVLVLVIPVSLLLAVLYSLLQLTKNNELTAMRASGVSLYRLMAPYMAVGLLFTVGVGIVHETIGPRCGYWAHQFLRYQKHQEEANVEEDVPFYNPTDRRDWFIQRLNTKELTMRHVEVTQEREDGSPSKKMLAGEVAWLDGSWWFRDVSIQEYDEEGNPVKQYDGAGVSVGITRHEREIERAGLTERPQDFINVTKEPEFLNSRELAAFVRTHEQASDETIARVKVDLHHRLAMPWMSLIVTLLGIPFGAQTARKGALMGVILSIALFFGYYFLINIGLWLGKEHVLPAWLAAWGPNMIFLSIGVVFVYRMR